MPPSRDPCTLTDTRATNDAPTANDSNVPTQPTPTTHTDSTAPCSAGSARPPPPAHRRLRRRGPRSLSSRRRRCGGAHPGDAGGHLPADSPVSPTLTPQHFSLLHINIRSINNPRKQAELNSLLDTHKPHFLALTETWLCNATPHFTLPNYHELSRRDRPNFTPAPGKNNHGGVLLLQRNDAPSASHLTTSTTAERTWTTIHTDTGPLLFGLWYRPPDDDDNSLHTLATELDELAPQHTGLFLTGDFNIHHRKWLRFSNSNTPQGELLFFV